MWKIIVLLLLFSVEFHSTNEHSAQSILFLLGDENRSFIKIEGALTFEYELFVFLARLLSFNRNVKEESIDCHR